MIELSGVNFSSPLSGGASGSNIMVTTRNHSVVSMVSLICPYKLQVLTHEVSDYLFVSRSSLGPGKSDENWIRIAKELQVLLGQ